MSYIKLNDISKDYLSGMCLVGDELSQLIVTSWDGTVSLYDWEQNSLLGRLRHEYALTSVAMCQGFSKCYVGSVQGEILEVDWESEKLVPVSSVSCELGIAAMGSYGHYLTVGSWDSSFIVLDTRRNSVIVHQNLSGKVLSLDCSENKVAVLTTAGIFVYHTNEIGSLPVRKDSGLKYQSRCIRLIPKDLGYVQSSVDGRVAVEFFDDNESKFAFRCHRLNLKDMQLVSPVNCMCFNPTTSMLYTGGSDGKIFVWNLVTRKKSEELAKLDDSIVAMCCNKKVLAVAVSDDSFKTSAAVEDIGLQSSKVCLKILGNASTP
ncbi:Bub3p Ecym_5584 [Eremothecium cymbalariae DBVPG|uniref:Uncharacterized protein n=1 Tax=Eremothecium cymbalariae (strain CBS 270.75 / DBVPG 7215 / KCTC 17166 / NRRL Y-17582) TaxID=931890 RepID=I6NE30_ERECY|nr:hypothetical protein Ecym_5584 [Eremothecium cymbalariae DBVPG\